MKKRNYIEKRQLSIKEEQKMTFLQPLLQTYKKSKATTLLAVAIK
tara:strand:- start:363 stop:497 length:135 start_codon:yes stop_codon:yes gene_type:complete